MADTPTAPVVVDPATPPTAPVPPADPPADPPTAPVAPPVAAPAPATPWYGEIQDQGLSEWVKTKNPPNAEAALKSYQNLEQVFGADKSGRTVIIPNDDSTNDEKNIFFTKLGRPDTAENYDLTVPDNANKDLVTWFKDQSHARGFSQQQANELFNAYNEFQASHTQTDTDAQAAQGKADHDALVTEWGPSYNDKVQMAKVAANNFGFTPEQINALQNTSSYSGIMKNFAEIGKAMGEAGLVNANTAPGFSGATLSPAEAQSKINELRSDKDWVKKYTGGDAAAMDTMHRLQAQVGK